MPRWDTRLRIAFDWTVSLFSRPDLTKIDLAPEREQERRNGAAGTVPVHTDLEPARGAAPALVVETRQPKFAESSI